MPNASVAAKTELIKAAAEVIDTKHDKWTTKNRRFRIALMRVVVENAGFTIIDDDDRYQIHMRTTNFFGYDHWGISIKMTKDDGSDGDRNYIQKIPPKNDPVGFVQYNCNTIWDEHLEMESFSILSLKKGHFDVLNLIP